MKKLFIFLVCSFLSVPVLLAQDTAVRTTYDSLKFSGQAAAWLMPFTQNDLPVWAGARYIPQLNYDVQLPSSKVLDFEASVNINGSLGVQPFSEFESQGSIKPYRLWARYAGERFELRAGLQKINFGSASLIRPLMWFDRIDPRDPLQLTDGVWGLLGRYYFLNNANIWIWGLYGNEKPSLWDVLATDKRTPEYGGRFQTPLAGGEVGLSYHHRTVTSHFVNGLFADSLLLPGKFPENRIGIDGKWDVVAGIWFEASWTNKEVKELPYFNNQHLLNVGADYTFGIGNGLNVILEQLVISQDETAFEMENAVNFTITSISYPLGLFDNLSAIIYYDWYNKSVYNYLRWKKEMNNFTFYGMLYFNPPKIQLPMQNDQNNLMVGNGLQLMVVYNH